MPIFYTKKGDKGYSYIGKKKINKNCIEVEALGELDELNSMIGVLKSQRIGRKLKDTLHQIQENLFIIQANVANIMMGSKYKALKFGSYKVNEAEKIIDDIERKIKPAKKFVISGTNQTSAWLDFLRATSRGVERAVLKVSMEKRGKALIHDTIPYLNRLSSLFFALARWEAKQAGKKEQNPTYK